MNSFARNLKRLLQRAGMSQHTLGVAIGVSQTMVSRWMSAGNIPDCYQTARIAEVFCLPLDVLVRGDVDTLSDRDLNRVRMVMEMLAHIGYDEAYRRLMLAGAESGVSAKGDITLSVVPSAHTIGRTVAIENVLDGLDGIPSRRPKGKEKNTKPGG